VTEDPDEVATVEPVFEVVPELMGDELELTPFPEVTTEPEDVLGILDVVEPGLVPAEPPTVDPVLD